MNRRIFLKNLYGMTSIGGALYIQPNTDFFSFLEKERSPYVPRSFERFSNDYKEIYASKSALDKTIQTIIAKKDNKSIINKYNKGEGYLGTSTKHTDHYVKNGNYHKNISAKKPSDFYSYFPSIGTMATPVFDFIMDEKQANVASGVQVLTHPSLKGFPLSFAFVEKNESLIKGDLKINDIIMVHPFFKDTLEDPNCYCKGVIPVTPPIGQICKDCNGIYFTQVFCFNNDGVAETLKQGKTYSILVCDAQKCKAPKNRKPGKDYGFHDGRTDINDLASCPAAYFEGQHEVQELSGDNFLKN